MYFSPYGEIPPYVLVFVFRCIVIFFIYFGISIPHLIAAFNLFLLIFVCSSFTLQNFGLLRDPYIFLLFFDFAGFFGFTYFLNENCISDNLTYCMLKILSLTMFNISFKLYN